MIRTALEEYAAKERPSPRAGLFASLGEPIAHRADEILAQGFGRR